MASGTRLRWSVSLHSMRTSWSAARTPSSSSTTRRCRRRARIRSGSRRNMRRPGQDCELPNLSVADAGARRGPGDGWPAAVPAGDLDRLQSSARSRRRAANIARRGPSRRFALAELDRLIAGVRFGTVLADAGYGMSAEFRQALSARGLAWAVGIPRHQKVYPREVELVFPVARRGRRANGMCQCSVRRRRRHARQSKVAHARLAEGNQGTLEGPLRRRPRARRRRTAATDRRQGYAAYARRRGLARRRAARLRRANAISRTCPRKPASRHWPRRSRRAGSASRLISNEGRTRPRPLRRPLMARSSPPCADDHDRIRLPSASSLGRCKTKGKSPRQRGKKVSAGPPQPTLPTIRRAIVVAWRALRLSMPHCRRQIRRQLS